MGSLGLHGGQGSEPHKQHVISRATASGPFGDGPMAVLLGSGPLAVAELLAVGFPAGLAQLFVDQLAGGDLIQLDRARSLAGRLPQSGGHSYRLPVGDTLQLLELGQQGRLVGLDLFGQTLPLLLLILGQLQLGFSSAELLSENPLVGTESLKGPLKPGQLLLQFVAFRQRRLGWTKRPAAKLRIAKRAVEPHPKLPGDLEGAQGTGMVAHQPMGGGVAGLAQVVEESCHFPLDQPLRLQAADQRQLGFLDRGEDAKARGHLLGQPLAQLPQLDQRRIGILREIPLRQEAQEEQLFVVGE